MGTSTRPLPVSCISGFGGRSGGLASRQSGSARSDQSSSAAEGSEPFLPGMPQPRSQKRGRGFSVCRVLVFVEIDTSFVFSEASTAKRSTLLARLALCGICTTRVRVERSRACANLADNGYLWDIP